MKTQKLTATGYRISRLGNIMKSIEKEAVVHTAYEGNVLKLDGTYYYFNRNQNGSFIYLP